LIRLVVFALGAVVPVHVHLQLAEVAVGQFAELQVDQQETTQQAVVEHEVDEEVVAVERDTLLSCDEAESLAEFEHELLQGGR
jgi:hypothetical protein